MSDFKSEVNFGLDNFQQPKVLSSEDSLAQCFLNLFFMKPGNMPSMPHIGINITSYLYKLEDDINENELKDKIYTQCSDLLPYIQIADVKVFVTDYKGQGLLLVVIPVTGGDTLTFGFSKNKSGDIYFNYDIQKDNPFQN